MGGGSQVKQLNELQTCKQLTLIINLKVLKGNNASWNDTQKRSFERSRRCTQRRSQQSQLQNLVNYSYIKQVFSPKGFRRSSKAVKEIDMFDCEIFNRHKLGFSVRSIRQFTLFINMNQ